MSETALLQLLTMIGAGIALITAMFKGSSFIITNLERRNQKLADELITAKTEAFSERISTLTIKLTKAEEDLAELKTRADKLREDLDYEKKAREAETKRATHAEYIAAAARKELERKQIEVDTLKSVLKMLDVSVPEGTVQITVVRTPLQESSTDELTDSAKKIVEDLHGSDLEKNPQ